MFPAITEKQCKFEQVDVLGGGAVMKALPHEGGGYDLVHDCGLVDSVAMVTACSNPSSFTNSFRTDSVFCFCRCATPLLTTLRRLSSAA